MAGGGGGGGDKRSSNADINLVPYIDLLSTLICFLLITAVWQQVSVITTNSTTSPPEDAFNPTPADPNKVDLSLKIFENRLELTAGKDVKTLNHANAQIDKTSFKSVLKEWKKQFPDKQDITINSEAAIPYKFLIQTMDTLIEENYIGLSINTN
ncbi:MAG: biopolymer transporter ExbD [Pseudobdellovibrio sp.]